MEEISMQVEKQIRINFVQEKQKILKREYIDYYLRWKNSGTLGKKLFCQTYENIEEVLRELEASGGIALIGVVEEYFVDRTKYLDYVIERFGE